MNIKKVLIFLYYEEERDELSRLIDEYHQKGAIITVVGSKVRPFNSKGIVYKNIEDYRTLSEGYKEASWKAGRLIEKWAEIKLNDSRRFEDIVTYKGLSLWRIIETNLLYTFLIPLIDNTRTIKKIIEKEKPDNIVLMTNDKLIEKLFLSLCDTLEIEVSVLSSRPPSKTLQLINGFMVRKTIILKGRLIPLWVPTFLIVYLSRFRVFLWYLLGMVKNSIYNYKSRGRRLKGEKVKVIFLTLCKRYADIVVPVIKELSKNSKNEVLVVNKRFSDARERLKEENIPYKIFDGYFNRAVRVSMYRETKVLSQKWKKLRSDLSFQKSFTYNGIPLWGVLEVKLSELFMKDFPEMIGIIETTRRIVREEAPHVLVVTEERSPFQRAFVMASKSLGTSTFAIQAAPYSEIWDGGSISTDKVAVDGQYCKDMLVSKGNNPDKIVITGQSRFDPLLLRDRTFDKEGICRELNLDSKRKLVTFFTQTVGLFVRGREKMLLLKGIFEAMKSLSEVQLVVKLHPTREFSDEIYRRTASEVGLKDFTILRNTDIWELLYISDAVIVINSTVGYEAIIMERPLIQDRISKSERDYLDYTKDGAAVPIYDIGRIKGAIEDALYNQEIKKALEEGRKKFISYHAYRIDGQSSKRVASLIEDISARVEVNRAV